MTSEQLIRTVFQDTFYFLALFPSKYEYDFSLTKSCGPTNRSVNNCLDNDSLNDIIS